MDMVEEFRDRIEQFFCDRVCTHDMDDECVAASLAIRGNIFYRVTESGLRLYLNSGRAGSRSIIQPACAVGYACEASTFVLIDVGVVKILQRNRVTYFRGLTVKRIEPLMGG